MTFRIGDDDIAGEGDEVSAEEIGRAIRKMRKTGQLKGMLASRPTGVTTPYGQEVLAHPTEVRADLYQVMGLGSVTNAAAGAFTLSQLFLERLKPSRLILTETTLGANIITGIFVGVRPQTANLAAMPVAGFAPGAFETRFSFDVGQIGQPFQVNGTTVGAAQTITGMCFGTVIKSFS